MIFVFDVHVHPGQDVSPAPSAREREPQGRQRDGRVVGAQRRAPRRHACAQRRELVPRERLVEVRANVEVDAALLEQGQGGAGLGTAWIVVNGDAHQMVPGKRKALF